MPLPMCPRCGKVEKSRHICTGSLEPTQDARKSAKRQQRRESMRLTTIEVSWETREELNKIRAELVRTVGKTRVVYDEAVRHLLSVYKSVNAKNDPG